MYTLIVDVITDAKKQNKLKNTIAIRSLVTYLEAFGFYVILSCLFFVSLINTKALLINDPGELNMKHIQLWN